jgi:hypothetical protein
MIAPDEFHFLTTTVLSRIRSAAKTATPDNGVSSLKRPAFGFQIGEQRIHRPINLHALLDKPPFRLRFSGTV